MMETAPQLDQKLRKSKRGTIVLVAAGLVLLGALVFFLVPREPSYKGKSLSYWLHEMNQAKSIENTAASSEAIRAIGTNALPFLLEGLKHKHHKWAFKLHNFIHNKSSFKIHFQHINAIRGPATHAVELLGKGATPLIPQLEIMLNDESYRFHAMAALLAIGSNSLPVLIKSCSHSNYNVRADSALFLTKINQGNTTLYKSWDRNGPYQRYFSVGWQYGTNEIAGLASNLKHPNSNIRRASADSLGWNGKANKQIAISSLIEALEDPNEEVRNAATEALKRIDPEAAAKAGVK